MPEIIVGLASLEIVDDYLESLKSKGFSVYGNSVTGSRGRVKHYSIGDKTSLVTVELGLILSNDEWDKLKINSNLGDEKIIDIDYEELRDNLRRQFCAVSVITEEKEKYEDFLNTIQYAANALALKLYDKTNDL